MPEFNEFYETERNKIGLIHWVQDPALPKGITARNEMRGTGNYKISKSSSKDFIKKNKEN